MTTISLTGVYVYPVKSAGGIAVRSWPVDEFGLRHDRRWMVVDRRGEACTQRDHPILALTRTTIDGERLRVTAPDRPPLDLPVRPSPSTPMTATVWGDACHSWDVGESAAGWFSELLGAPCRLVYMPEESRRTVDPDFAPVGSRVSYADGFPFLLLSEESLADLNGRLSRPVPMNRFRPNLVIAGGDPYVEDRCRSFRLGTVELQVVKPCDRCVLTTIDQDTGERGPEPLRTLATYRRVGGKVLFGQNVIPRGTGRLGVGDILRM